jgi:hypothetical protein
VSGRSRSGRSEFVQGTGTCFAFSAAKLGTSPGFIGCSDGANRRLRKRWEIRFAALQSDQPNSESVGGPSAQQALRMRRQRAAQSESRTVVEGPERNYPFSQVAFKEKGPC